MGWKRPSCDLPFFPISSRNLITGSLSLTFSQIQTNLLRGPGWRRTYSPPASATLSVRSVCWYGWAGFHRCIIPNHALEEWILLTHLISLLHRDLNRTWYGFWKLARGGTPHNTLRPQRQNSDCAINEGKCVSFRQKLRRTKLTKIDGSTG